MQCFSVWMDCVAFINSSMASVLGCQDEITDWGPPLGLPVRCAATHMKAYRSSLSVSQPLTMISICAMSESTWIFIQYCWAMQVSKICKRIGIQPEAKGMIISSQGLLLMRRASRKEVLPRRTHLIQMKWIPFFWSGPLKKLSRRVDVNFIWECRFWGTTVYGINSNCFDFFGKHIFETEKVDCISNYYSLVKDPNLTICL